MSSGGGKSKTPRLLDDNLRSKQFYKVLDLISEGPIMGPVDQEHLSSFHLNNTPVTDEKGNTNIPGITVAWRNGSETQAPINGFAAIEATTMVGTDVTYGTPLIRTITDPTVTRVRFNVGVTGLVQQDTKGNQDNATVVMVLETRTGTTWVNRQTVTITGKISGEFLQAYVIEAPETKPFDIRVRRITPDSASDLLSNGTIWNSYVAITDDNLSYPFCSVVGAVVDRDQYTDTPERSYLMRGRIVDVPDNYDPETRTYNGLWTGGLKQAYTDNPAWIFRDVAKNTRYGLAKAAGYIETDDGSLYVLSQYCDQMIDNGYGGTEPRFTCNVYITEQSSAREILDNIAGMCRSIALWDGMRLSVVTDRPADPIASVTNANVVDGDFKYTSSKLSERYNAVVVSWVNPDNGWETVKEYVSDETLIKRFNYNETTMEAYGCTSRGQAWRAGKWLLETAKLESKVVSFQMARDAIAFTPGDIIELADNHYAGTRLGGRIVSHSGKTITLDADISEYATATGSYIRLFGASGKWDKYSIASVSGSVVTLVDTPAVVRDGTVFTVSTPAVSTRLFRITGISESDNNSVYDITASLHNPNKQAIVDEGAVFEAPTDSVNAFRVPNIENLRIINTASETVQVTATWETATTTRALTFEVTVYSAENTVAAYYETDQFRYEFYGLNAGTYTLGVRGRNESGMKGAETQVDMIIGAPVKPSSVQWIEGIFSATLVPVMQITATSDTSYEFWYAGETPLTGDIVNQAQFLGRSTQWVLNGLKADTTYYAYVRTRNAFGASDFVEASGKASSEIPGMLDFIDQGIRDSGAFKNLQTISETSIEAILQNGMAIDASVEHQWAQYGEVRADVLHITTTIADVEKAFAEYQTIVQAQFDTTIAQVNQKLTASVTSEGTASAYYDLGLQIVRNDVAYKTGVAMGIEPDGSGYKSTIVFAADQFGIYSGSDPASWKAAFFVYQGQVFMNSAFIQDASITNVKIGEYIQSNNYVSGSTGWRIDKSGIFEINSTDPGTGRMVITGNNINVYDENGILRVKMGKK